MTKEMLYFDPRDLKKVILEMGISTRELCATLDISLGGLHYIKSKGRISTTSFQELKKEYKKRLKKSLELNEETAKKNALINDGRKLSSAKKTKKEIDLSTVPYEELVAEIKKRNKEMKKMIKMTQNLD